MSAPRPTHIECHVRKLRDSWGCLLAKHLTLQFANVILFRISLNPFAETVPGLGVDKLQDRMLRAAVVELTL